MTPERSINHHFTYHVAQASQAKHGSLVDRGANGGLAGSDVRILSRSSRKCTVTGIDSHELQGLDVVQCAALVQTNHGIVTEFRQPIQVQSHLEMPGILVQLGHIQRT